MTDISVEKTVLKMKNCTMIIVKSIYPLLPFDFPYDIMVYFTHSKYDIE